MSIRSLRHRGRVGAGVVPLVVALALAVMVVAPQPAAAQAPESAADGFTICGGLGPGAEVDIVVLMDVSLSLVRGGADNRGSDPSGVRFDAVDRLIDGLALTSDGSQPPRNVAVVTFGGESGVVVPFSDPLSSANATVLRRAIRDRADPTTLPNEVTFFTNYVVAIEAATALFQTRPSQNCRVLVWFTDGIHDPNNDGSVAADGPEADALLDEFCGADGLVMRLREQDVAPFVLFLEPDVRPAFTQRLRASVAVMTAVTGDPAPRFGRLGPVETPACDVPATGKVGEILPASEADRLIGLLGDLANAIDGGRPAAPDACPYERGAVESYRLPDAHLVDWISLASYDLARTVTVADLRAVSGDDAVVEGALEVLSGTGTGSVRVTVRAAARERLGAGWRLELEEATDLCLRLKLRALTFEVSGRPSVRPLIPSDLPVDLHVDRLSLIGRDGRRIALEAGVVIPPGVRGLLRIDESAPFVPSGLLPVSVVVVGAPSIDCSLLEVPDPATRAVTLGRVSVPDGPLVSTTCALGVEAIEEEVTIDASAAIASLGAACPAGSSWELVAREGDVLRAIATTHVVSPGAPLSGVLLRTSGEVPNRDIDCTEIALAPLLVTWQGATTEVPVRFDVTLAARPNTLATLIGTLIATVVAALLSLVLLKVLNAQWLVPPPAATLQGYEKSGQLVARGEGQVAVEFPGGGFTFDQDEWRKVVPAGPGSLQVAGVVLKRRLPSILKPWSEPVLKVGPDGSGIGAAVAQPHGARDDEMPCAFRDAVILSAVVRRSPTPETSVPVRVTVILPRTGPGSGRTNVERLVDEALPALGRRLRSRLEEVQNDDRSKGPGPSGGGPGSPGSSGPQGPGAAPPKPPQPPKPPSGPGPSGPPRNATGPAQVHGSASGSGTSGGPRPPTGPPQPPKTSM